MLDSTKTGAFKRLDKTGFWQDSYASNRERFRMERGRRTIPYFRASMGVRKYFLVAGWGQSETFGSDPRANEKDTESRRKRKEKKKEEETTAERLLTTWAARV